MNFIDLYCEIEKKKENGVLKNINGHDLLTTANFESFLPENQADAYGLVSSYYAKAKYEKPIKGLVLRTANNNYLNSREWYKQEMHDNLFGACYLSSEAGKEIVKYLIKNLGYYCAYSFGDLYHVYGLKGALSIVLERTRQPYQFGAYCLMSYKFCDPISYLHLLLVILIEYFKPVTNTSGKLLLRLLCIKTKDTLMGKPLAWLFNNLMTVKYGSIYWTDTIFNIYYGNSFPELAELAHRAGDDK